MKDTDTDTPKKNLFKPIAVATFWVVAILVGTYVTFWATSEWQRGIYAGFHYDGAKSYAQEVVARKYGLRLAQQMRLATPDVVNTHGHATLFKPGGQVREFHLLGPRGVRYCVSVWGGGRDWGRNYQIVKGCRF